MRRPGKLIKAEKWWDEKAPLMLGLAYFLLAVSDPVVSPMMYLPDMLAFVVAFIGVAGYGHVVNDLADRQHDRVAGKRNAMQGKSRGQATLIVVALLALSAAPWLILPASRWNLSLIPLQLLLLTVYAVPPLRFKIRAIPGVITDALYAYTVPVLITWTTWNSVAGATKPHVLLLGTLVLWSFSVGLRGILNHQYLDAENDARSGIDTFATQFGRVRTLWVVSRLVLPLEMLCFAVMTAALAQVFWPYLLGIAVFFCWRAFEIDYLENQQADADRLGPSEHFVQRYGYKFLGEFYALWFPVFMLVALVHRSFAYLPLAIAHLVLFRTGVRRLSGYDLSYLRTGMARVRRQHA